MRKVSKLIVCYFVGVMIILVYNNNLSLSLLLVPWILVLSRFLWEWILVLLYTIKIFVVS